MKSWIAFLCLTVIVNAQSPQQYPIYPGIGAIYKNLPNAPTFVDGPDGRIIPGEGGGEADPRRRPRPEPVYARDPRPENVVISKKGPTVIAEEVVSKSGGPNLIVGKIAQPLSLDGNVQNSNDNKPLDSQSTGSNSGRGGRQPQTVVANGPRGLYGHGGDGYAPTTISGSQAGFDNKDIERRVNERPPQEARGRRPIADGQIYPPVMFDDPNIADLIPDGPVIVDEQIARDHLYIQDGPLYHPETGTLYHPGPGTVFRGGQPRRPMMMMPAPVAPPVRRLNPPVYDYAKFSPTIVIRSGPAITRLEPVLTTIPVAAILDTAPIYVTPKVLPSVAVAKDTVRTIAESRLDVLQPAPYLTPPEFKEPIILNKW